MDSSRNIAHDLSDGWPIDWPQDGQPNRHWLTYRKVKWRGTLPVWPKTQELAVFFDTIDGQILRCRITVASAEHLIGALQDAIDRYRRGGMNVHSDKSEGNPILEGSMRSGSDPT